MEHYVVLYYLLYCTVCCITVALLRIFNATSHYMVCNISYNVALHGALHGSLHV